MTALPGLYVGAVMHCRHKPRIHRFCYRAFWMLMDFGKLPVIGNQLHLFSYNRFNLFSLRDRDHGDGTDTPLLAPVRQQLHEAGIDIADSRTLLFAMPRTFGCAFNPLGIYFCDWPDRTMAALIYQVHNSFGERHRYLIPVTDNGGSARQRCRKNFYVSPYLGMDLEYRFRASYPAEKIAIGIRVEATAVPLLDAALAATRSSSSR